MTWINFTEAPINPFKMDRIWWEAGICLEKHGWLIRRPESSFGAMLHRYASSKDGFPMLQEDFNGDIDPEEHKVLPSVKEGIDRTPYINPEENIAFQMLLPNPQSGERGHYDTKEAQQLCTHWASFTDQYFALVGASRNLFLDKYRLSTAFQDFLENCKLIFKDKGRFMYLFPKEQLHFVLAELFRPGLRTSFYIFPFSYSTENIEKAPWFAWLSELKDFSSSFLLDTFAQLVKEFGWFLTTHSNHPYLRPLCFYVAPNISILPSKNTLKWQHFDDMYVLLDKIKDLQVHHQPRRGLRSKYTPTQLRRRKEINLINTDIVHLEDLKEYPNITSLALYHNFAWNLGNTLQQMSHLKRLTLGQMEVDSYDFLEGMTSLEYLQINRVYNDGVLQLPAILKLEELDLESNWARLTSGKLHVLQLTKTLGSLKKLNLAATSIKSLQFVEYCPSLEELVLDSTPVDNFSSLEKLGNLKSLSISSLSTLESIVLPNLPTLEYLNLGSNELENLRSYAHLTSLKTLKFYGNRIANLQELQYFTQVTCLDLSNNSIERIDKLPDLPHLKTLLLDEQAMDYTPLKHHTFPSLKKLSLSSSNFEDLSCIQHFSTLEDLGISGTLLKDFSLLATFPNLETLEVDSYELADTNLAQIHLPQLASLSLNYSKFTNLSFLKNFTSLQKLSLRGLSGYPPEKKINLNDLPRSASQLEEVDIRDTAPTNWHSLLELKNLKKIIITSNLISKEIIQQFGEKGVIVEEDDIR